MKNDQIDRGIETVRGWGTELREVYRHDLITFLEAMREPEVDGECQYCKPEVGKAIAVDNIKNPRCSACNRLLAAKEPEKEYCDCGEELIDGRCPLEPEREFKRKEPEEKTPNKPSNVIITKKEYEFLKASEKPKVKASDILPFEEAPPDPIREVYEKHKDIINGKTIAGSYLDEVLIAFCKAIKKYCEEDK